MKEIKLTQGKVALVDDADFGFLNQFKWHAEKQSTCWYAIGSSLDTRNKRQKTNIRLHRLIMLVFDPNIWVDHKDCNGLNCQRSNLGISNRLTNAKNIRRNGNKTSKYKGVYKTPQGRWRASIGYDGLRARLGIHKTEDDAARAYNAGSLKYHGEFANLNIIQ